MSVDYYLTIKAFHILAFTAWMAGNFYLPRLFVYHTQVIDDERAYSLFTTMEGKLLRFIMGPAAITTWVLGLLLTYYLFAGVGWPPLWFYIKLAAVVLMTAFHIVCIGMHRAFAARANEKTERYFRIFNEAPTVLLIVIVFSVIFQPG